MIAVTEASVRSSSRTSAVKCALRLDHMLHPRCARTLAGRARDRHLASGHEKDRAICTFDCTLRAAAEQDLTQMVVAVGAHDHHISAVGTSGREQGTGVERLSRSRTCASATMPFQASSRTTSPTGIKRVSPPSSLTLTTTTRRALARRGIAAETRPGSVARLLPAHHGDVESVHGSSGWRNEQGPAASDQQRLQTIWWKSVEPARACHDDEIVVTRMKQQALHRLTLVKAPAPCERVLRAGRLDPSGCRCWRRTRVRCNRLATNVPDLC